MRRQSSKTFMRLHAGSHRTARGSILVKDAATMCSMSERNFQRLFKCEIGVTPSAYLLRARLEHTCRLLAGSDLPVDKIARRSGFGSGERLSKIFRKTFSTSPTEFRSRSRMTQ